MDEKNANYIHANRYPVAAAQNLPQQKRDQMCDLRLAPPHRVGLGAPHMVPTEKEDPGLRQVNYR